MWTFSCLSAVRDVLLHHTTILRLNIRILYYFRIQQYLKMLMHVYNVAFLEMSGQTHNPTFLHPRDCSYFDLSVNAKKFRLLLALIRLTIVFSALIIIYHCIWRVHIEPRFFDDRVISVIVFIETPWILVMYVFTAKPCWRLVRKFSACALVWMTVCTSTWMHRINHPILSLSFVEIVLRTWLIETIHALAGTIWIGICSLLANNFIPAILIRYSQRVAKYYVDYTLSVCPIRIASYADCPITWRYEMRNIITSDTTLPTALLDIIYAYLDVPSVLNLYTDSVRSHIIHWYCQDKDTNVDDELCDVPYVPTVEEEYGLNVKDTCVWINREKVVTRYVYKEFDEQFSYVINVPLQVGHVPLRIYVPVLNVLDHPLGGVSVCVMDDAMEMWTTSRGRDNFFLLRQIASSVRCDYGSFNTQFMHRCDVGIERRSYNLILNNSRPFTTNRCKIGWKKRLIDLVQSENGVSWITVEVGIEPYRYDTKYRIDSRPHLKVCFEWLEDDVHIE